MIISCSATFSNSVVAITEFCTAGTTYMYGWVGSQVTLFCFIGSELSTFFMNWLLWQFNRCTLTDESHRTVEVRCYNRRGGSQKYRHPLLEKPVQQELLHILDPFIFKFHLSTIMHVDSLSYSTNVLAQSILLILFLLKVAVHQRSPLSRQVKTATWRLIWRHAYEVCYCQRLLALFRAFVQAANYQQQSFDAFVGYP